MVLLSPDLAANQFFRQSNIGFEKVLHSYQSAKIFNPLLMVQQPPFLFSLLMSK